MVRRSRDILGLGLGGLGTPATLWAGHSRNTLNWALHPGRSEVGHSRDEQKVDRAQIRVPGEESSSV